MNLSLSLYIYIYVYMYMYIYLSLSLCIYIYIYIPGLLEAHGELVDAEGHEEGLLRVVVGEVRADADDGGELRLVQHRDLVRDDLPEGLALGAHGSHFDILVAYIYIYIYIIRMYTHNIHNIRVHVCILVAQHGDARARAEDVLGHGAVLHVGLAAHVVVRVGGVHALLASRGPSGFSKGGFSNNNTIITHKLLNPPLLNPPL